MIRRNHFKLLGIPYAWKQNKLHPFSVLYFNQINQRVFSTTIKDKQFKKKSEIKTSKYRHTLLPLSTEFKRNPIGKNRVLNDANINKVAEFSSLYDRQANSNREQEFILHDGPPYANGELHMGHALNKVLKDVTVRYKYIKGYKVNFKPGWDCHGLPIELKALEKAKSQNETSENWENLSPIEIRDKARSLADEIIEVQKHTFDQWGLFVNWTKHYSTKDPKYVAKQLKLFFQLYKKGFIFQGYMPVYFSPSSKTTLAESELEYNENHVSPSLYLALPLADKGKNSIAMKTSLPLYICIWTTTPWTLPGNMAICVNPDMEYTIVTTEVNGRKVALLWGKDREEDLKTVLQNSYEIASCVTGKDLVGLEYIHPVYGNTLKVIAGSHVSNSKGTGLVHTAPPHGKDDFLVALANDIPTDVQLVDHNGCFKREAGDQLKGLNVLEHGDEAVIKLISSFETTESSPLILNLGTITHSYPYDWRTKKPTITLASKQWFFDVNKVKGSALNALEDITILPPKLKNSFIKVIDSRPYWCLSRQRVWGVPIPVFYDAETLEPVISSETIDHVSNLIEKEGTDVWWKYSEEQLLPKNYMQQLKLSGKKLPRKGNDILDIWFDSGSSWYCAMNGKKADVYVEGLDQINGWFQSSLLISIAATGEAPYKKLVLHSFIVDEQRQKMSKSFGNVYNPSLVTNGGKNLKKNPPWGVNVLRWWAINSSPFRDVYMGNDTLKKCENDLVAIRSTFWFSLASLHNFTTEKMLPYHQLRLQDKYILSLVKPYLDQVWKHYENFEYDNVTRIISNFIKQISEEYLNTTKDILYCDQENDINRRSIQTTIYSFLPHIVCSMAPILPHLAEEVAMSFPKSKDKIMLSEGELMPPPKWNQEDPEIKKLVEIKSAFMRQFGEIEAADKDVDNNGEEIKGNGGGDEIIADKKGTSARSFKPYKVHLKFGKSHEETIKMIQTSNKEYHSNLCSFLGISEATIEYCSSQLEGFTLNISRAEGSFCLRCRKFSVEDGSDMCLRCKEVVH